MARIPETSWGVEQAAAIVSSCGILLSHRSLSRCTALPPCDGSLGFDCGMFFVSAFRRGVVFWANKSERSLRSSPVFAGSKYPEGQKLKGKRPDVGVVLTTTVSTSRASGVQSMFSSLGTFPQCLLFQQAGPTSIYIYLYTHDRGTS